MQTKRCSKCKVQKSFEDFYKSTQTKLGLSCWCKDCEKEAKRKLLSSGEHRKKRNLYLVGYRKKNHISTWLRHTRSRALKAGIAFNLTKEDFVIPDVCPVLGIPIRRGDYGAAYTSPSIDRIVPELGYTKGNVRIISYRANWLKNNATPKEIELLYLDSLTQKNRLT